MYKILIIERHLLSFLAELSNASPLSILLIGLIVLIIFSPKILRAYGKLNIDLAISNSIKKSAERDEQH